MIQGGSRAFNFQTTFQANILGGQELWHEATGRKKASTLGKRSLQRHKVSVERPAFHWDVLQPYHQGTISLSGILTENSLFLQLFCGTSSWIHNFYSALTPCLIICLSPCQRPFLKRSTRLWGKMLFTPLSPDCQLRCQCEQPPAHSSWNKSGHF